MSTWTIANQTTNPIGLYGWGLEANGTNSAPITLPPAPATIQITSPVAAAAIAGTAGAGDVYTITKTS